MTEDDLREFDEIIKAANDMTLIEETERHLKSVRENIAKLKRFLRTA